MIVVFDTNIWLTELGLNSSVGAAVRFYLRKGEHQVALPEVVRLEATQNFTRTLTDFVKDIQSKYSQLLTVFGSLKEIKLPSSQQIQDRVARLFDGLSIQINDIPFTLTSARRSFIKTIEGTPPSGPKNQQFKDGVLWADCMSLLETDDVALVTKDKNFFENRNYQDGLSRSLEEEASAKPHNIMLFSSLSELLADIQTEIHLDKEKLANSYVSAHRQKIDGFLAASGYYLDRLLDVETKLFITEKVETLYVEFQIKYSCTNAISGDLPEGQLTINGDGTYSSLSETFAELTERDSELTYTKEDGTTESKRSVTLRADGIVLGHRDRTHTVRRPVD